MVQPEELESPPLAASVADLRAAGPGEAALQIVESLAERGPFWLHFDVDVLDPAGFPATDYLLPGGMDWEELQATIRPFLASEALTGASLGCYNPEKDPSRSCGKALVALLGR